MNTFLFYFAFEIVSLLFLNKYAKKNSKTFLILSMLPLVILVGFRSINVGTDTNGYVNAFYRLMDGTMSSVDIAWLSFGYRFIAKVVGTIFGKNYIMLNLTIAILTLTFMYKSITNNSKDEVMSLYILFSTCLFYQLFNQSRQMLSIAIVLYSYKFIRNRNLKYFLISIILATLIHSSAIIFLPFYFLSNIELNKKSIFKYLFMFLFMFLAWNFMFKLISMTKYGQTYILTNYYQASNSSIINFIFRFCLIVFLFLFKKSADSDENNKYLYNIGIWCTVFSFITIRYYIFGRISTYFYAFYILIVPNILSTLKKNKNFYKGIMYIIFFMLHIVYFMLMCKSGGYDFYSFFFQHI